jgi:hypothetical protein
MSPEKSIAHLYHKYKKSREIPFSQEQFTSFIAFFPVLLVAASDGVVDREEWRYCQKLAGGLVASYGKTETPQEADALTRLYRKEFVFLLSNLEEWEEAFLLALEAYFQLHPYAKKFVTQTVYLFADASEGICEEEQNTMEYLCLRLKLDTNDLQPFDELEEYTEVPAE